jgi:cell division protein FtsW (lipid II flippase)/cell division protein FtsI/penicillin-binding protein 2
VAVALGLLLTYFARTARLAESNPTAAINVNRLSGPDDFGSLLTAFEESRERQLVAQALYNRAIAEPHLEHVGGLAAVTVPAADVQRDPRLIKLQARLAQHPGAGHVTALSSSDLAALKPRLIVRSEQEFAAAIAAAAAWFFAAFWAVHVIRRYRTADDDPLLLPIVQLLSGVGLMTMLSLRDPLRDTIAATTFVSGVVIGLALLTAVSELDFEVPRLRRAMLAPLGLALFLAALLLLFGRGPGASGVKVNLFGFQPVEVIRLLIMLSLSSYFARRLDVLRELSEPAAASHPWLKHLRVPRWKDVRPLVISMALLLGFFFLQKDLGPALVLSCMFLALYGVARGRVAFVTVGFLILVGGFAAAYVVSFPATVRQRVTIWFDPWNNGIVGGNQIAHGLWGMSTGALWGTGPGLGEPQSIPAAYTDFVLAAIGEELGFVGLALVVVLYTMLCWRCLRIAARASGDYSAFVATAAALALVVQASVIGCGLLGLVPLSGVVTPFLSYGRSSMIANSMAVGIVLAIAKRRGRVRVHLQRPIAAVAATLGGVAIVLLCRAAWIQIVRADEIAAASSLSEQADGGVRFEYNPRLVSASHLLVRGTIYDRNGLPLATSRPDEIQTLDTAFRRAGITLDRPCTSDLPRCYPLGGLVFHIVGDWNHQTNWGASNSSYLERDRDSDLKGYDDHPQLVDIVNPRSGGTERAVKRDLRQLLPLVRNRYRMNSAAVRTLIDRNRDLYSSIDARLQVRAAAAVRARIAGDGLKHGAAVVLDPESGELLAAVSYPWPTADDLAHGTTSLGEEGGDRFLDRARYGLFPPGSTFKVLVAGAALRAAERSSHFACIRLPDGRVGNYVRGGRRPVRDDPLDTTPHGVVDLRRGLVVSCNAYFAQLAMQLGPRALIDAASLFQIAMSRPSTAAALEPNLAQTGYGQAQVVVSPLKMARVAAAVAAHGVVPAVSWTRTPPAEKQSGRRFLSSADAALLSRYLREVVTSGTGRMLAANPTGIAGKTGTAEVQDGRAHSWFAGFAPFAGEGRHIAFSIIVEHAGYGGRVAAPIAGEIVSAARDIGVIK